MRSELQSEGELPVPRIGSRAGDLAEGSVVRVGIRSPEVRMVPGVVAFGAELRRDALRHGEVFDRRKIPSRAAIAADAAQQQRERADVVVQTLAVIPIEAGLRVEPTFHATFAVPPKNADARVSLTAIVTDHRGNETTTGHEVIFERVDDATIPTAAWITPLDGAALPANVADWTATLRVRATDDVKVTAVRFESTALSAPITLTAPTGGSTDIFETSASLVMPASPRKGQPASSFRS